MTAALLAALFAAATALPEGKARYRFELGGEHVGVVEISVACFGERCTAVYTSERRAPADAGGRRSSHQVEVEVDREGRWRGGKLRVTEDGARLKATGVDGAVPAFLAEVVLARAIPAAPRKGWQSALPPGPELCIDAFDEASGERGKACARREGDALGGATLGIAEAIAPSTDGFPAAVAIPAHGVRFVRDADATTPREPPRLHGTVVAGPEDPASADAFCGVKRDPEPPAAAEVAFLPEPRADGASCREKAAAWLRRAAHAGLTGRSAVGVAWDGGRFVWHAWAEVRLERGWIAVDPSFGERPARGPRFTVATYDDERSRAKAGERILACWGRARVEPR